jgi:P27 family predicted phage terminase small subunit
MPEAWLEPSRWNPLRRKVWRATVKELEPLGILAKADKEVLISFVEAVVLRERATAELEEDDLLVRTENGYIRNPNLLTLKQATDSIEKLARQLGCTPAIRLRMPRPEPDDEDLAL